MKHKYILYVVTDKDNNLYVERDGMIKHVAEIAEHDERMSMQMHVENGAVIIDEKEFSAINHEPIHFDTFEGMKRNMFTNVVTDDSEILTKCEKRDSKYFKTVPKNAALSLVNNMELHNTRRPMLLFISGGSELIKKFLPYITTVLWTRTEHTTTDKVVDKLPIELFRKYFKRTCEVESERTQSMRELGLNPNTKKRYEDRVIGISGNTKLVQRVEVPDLDYNGFDHKFLTLERKRK